MDFSNSALMGALIGATLGLFHYVIILSVMGRVVARDMADPEAEPVTDEGRAKVRQSMRYIKPAVMLGSFVLFPITGYFVGKQFAS